MDSSLEKKLSGFRQIAQEKLQNIFCSIPGIKDIIIEPNLIKPLEQICGASWLRKKGIDKIYKFDQKSQPKKQKNFIYFIPSDLLIFKNVLDQINSYESRNQMDNLENEKSYHVILFPQVLKTFEILLEEEGLCGCTALYKFQWDFISMDVGVLSLEIPQVFRNVFVHRDTSLLPSLATSLRLLNLVMKRPNLVLTYGENAEIVYNMTSRMENFQRPHAHEDPNESSDFNAMLIVDRNRDYPSCLLTPVIYSGLLLELYEYRSGTITIDTNSNRVKAAKLQFLQRHKEQQSVPPHKSEVSHLRLQSNTDTIYSDNKYHHFSDVVGLLSQQTKSLNLDGKNYRDMKINEMKEYVTNQLPKVAAQKKELYKHLLLCETIVQELAGQFEKRQNIESAILQNSNRKSIMQFVEELLSTDAHKYNTVRLLCLIHIAMGLGQDETTRFIHNYLNAFGHQYMHVFSNLCRARLLPDTLAAPPKNMKTISQAISKLVVKSQFQIEANKLRLLPCDLEDESSMKTQPSTSSAAAGSLKRDPTCPSYVFNGNYVPLIAQLASILLRSPNFEEVQQKLGHLEQCKVAGRRFDAQLRAVREARENPGGFRLFPLKPRTLFVFVVGGVTYAEIAACNLVERFTGAKIVLASNAIVSGCDIIEAAFK